VSMKTFRGAELTVETKADGSPVTEVDRRVEGVLRDSLARYHPSDRVVGEEFGGVILVEEAGGVASDIQGQARFDGGSLLVTNGRLHSQVLATLGS
jgi:histidinol-phosphatase